MKFEWEGIKFEQTGTSYDGTQRAKVIGGWIVRHNSFDSDADGNTQAIGMVFVPDPKHEWEID